MPTANKWSLYLATLIFVLSALYWLTPVATFWENGVVVNANSDSVSNEFKRAFQYEQAGKYLQALKWYQRAAEAGEPSAQYRLGNLYHQGQGVPQDTTLALKWYQQAAQAGYAPAQQQLQQLNVEVQKSASGDTEPNSNSTTVTDSKETHPSEIVPDTTSTTSPPATHPLPPPTESVETTTDEEDVETTTGVAESDHTVSAELPLRLEERLALLQYLYAQGRYPEVMTQGSAITESSPAIKQLVKQAEQVQMAWVKVNQLIEQGQFKTAYNLARPYKEPELQQLALRAQRELGIVLKELEYLSAKRDYATVIIRGESKSEDNPEIKKLVERAREIEATRTKITQLVAEKQLAAAYQLANSAKDTTFREFAIEIQKQISQAEAELAYLLAQGQYQQVLSQGAGKVMWSKTIKGLVNKAEVAHKKQLLLQETEKKQLALQAEKEQLALNQPEESEKKLLPQVEKEDSAKTTEVAKDAPAVKPISIAVFGDSLADGIWGGVYRLLRNDKRFKVHRETVTASGLVRYDWLNRVKKLLNQKEIDIAIVLMGTNDGQMIVTGKQRLSYQSEAWKQAYTERVNQLMALLQEHQVTTFWVGLPTMRLNTLDKQAEMLNHLYQERSAHFNGIYFVPTIPLTANEQGKYVAYLADHSGRKKLLRANDGVHFTMTGYDLLARHIIDNVYRRVPDLRKELHDS